MGESYDMETLVQRGFEKRDHIDIIYSSPTNNSNRIMKDVYEKLFRKYKVEHKISKENINTVALLQSIGPTRFIIKLKDF